MRHAIFIYLYYMYIRIYVMYACLMFIYIMRKKFNFLSIFNNLYVVPQYQLKYVQMPNT